MGYLVLKDYGQYIQGDLLRQITQGNDAKRITEENTSIQTIAQRLQQKYDLNSEFTQTQPYDKTKIYGAADRVTVDLSVNGFKAWVAGAHVAGDLVINGGNGYISPGSFTDSTFDPTQWTYVAPQYTIYYAAYPSTCTLQGVANPATLTDPYAPVFNYKSIYAKGDIAWWRGSTYVCNQPSTVLCHGAILQYATYSNIPYANVFPDDPVGNAGGAYWTTKTAYTVPAATPLTDARWTQGDNRNQVIKMAMIVITVFKLSPLIAPVNRPAIWLEDYRSMLRELKECAEGQMTLNLPLRQPNNATRSYHGGNIKQDNWY